MQATARQDRRPDHPRRRAPQGDRRGALRLGHAAGQSGLCLSRHQRDRARADRRHRRQRDARDARRARHPDPCAMSAARSSRPSCSATAAMSARRSCRWARTGSGMTARSSRSCSPRPSRRRATGAHRLAIRYAPEQPSAGFDSAGATTVAAKDASKEHEDPEVGDARRRLCRGAGQDRRAIRDADPAPQPDRAVHHQLRLGRRQADRLGGEPERHRAQERAGRAARHRAGQNPCRLAVHRRRVRLARLADPAHRADRRRGAAARPPGQAGGDARPGLHDRHLPRRDPAPRQARRRPRRQARVADPTRAGR